MLELDKETKILRDIEEQLLLEGHSLWGHGTSTKEIADTIIRNGILVNPSYGLTEMAVPMTNASKSKTENSKAVLDLSMNWPHKQSRFVVLIEVPDETSRDQVTELVMVKGRERSRLPNRFIRGYFDVLNISLTLNPDFEANAAPTEKIVVSAGPRVKDGEIIEIPTAPKNGVEDVW